MIKKIAASLGLAVALVLGGMSSIPAQATTVSVASPSADQPLSALRPTSVPPKITATNHSKPMKGIKANKAAPVSSNGGGVTTQATTACAAPPCYFYVGGSQTVANTGVYANMVINWSYTDLTSRDNMAHNVTELDVETKRVNNNRDIVEVGTVSDRSMSATGNDNPIFFVFHWVNGVPQGYNTGFVNYTGVDNCDYHPGDDMSAINGTAVKVGVEYSGGNWWVSEGAKWCGYIPADPAATNIAGNRWYGSGANFTSAAKYQAFGEVTSAFNEPCTDMGNGRQGSSFVTPWTYPADPSYIASVAGVGVATNSMTYYRAPTVAAFTQTAASVRTFYYGGPGYNNTGGLPGTGGIC